ncbi:alpha-2-HS-glycoprotein-like [Megalops cyprinoides]|uniref:alpha-2-HS-glycoprotein-like n=1 Tax=Megalops cyprinoides TaxID=118141 RepID=UPI001863B0CA|nr:alpha-2-HS-glycoprotein-like [Megalops cyprinoides]
MRPIGALVVLGLLVGAWGQVPLRPPCDSLEVEEAGLVSQDYINSQFSHGYKYALNQIEDVKIYPKADGGETMVLDLELLETKCHILDPTPVANCTVRPRHETKVEADCDVILSKAGGVLSVLSYKCKSEPESAEDMCVGCPLLEPLNHTDALQVVASSLAQFNLRPDNNTAKFALRDVGRLSSQIVSGGPQFLTEYAIVETNCTVDDDGICIPLPDPLARTGFCIAKGVPAAATVDCTVFDIAVPPLPPLVNATDAVVPPVVPPFQTIHGLKHHHRKSAIHDPALASLLSESAESQEMAAPIVKRQVPAETQIDPPVAAQLPPLPVCPGKVKHF